MPRSPVSGSRPRRRAIWPRRIAAVLTVLLLGVTVTALSACALSAPPDSVPKPSAAPPAASLGTVEIQAFEGKQLDAIAREPETSIKGPQEVDIATCRLPVTDMMRAQKTLTCDEVLAMPVYRKVTTLHCIDGWSVTATLPPDIGWGDSPRC